MTAHILSIGTALPQTTIEQDDVRDFFARQPGYDRLASRLVHAAFDAAAIERRHTVVTELADGGTHGRDVFVSADGVLQAPSTGVRNAVYAAEAPALFAEAARAALTEAGITADAVTHVVTASCTGFFAPGPDYRLIRDLGLPATVERYHLGFLGCAAAFPALRTASHICASRPDAVVLVVCAELCSLHIRSSTEPDQIVASSVFADGAAAAVVSGRPGSGPSLELERFGTSVTSEGETDMVWLIGDEGFEMTLTAEVPRIIGREILDVVTGFLDAAPGDERPWGVDAWAVHPGGRSILDRVESSLSLDPAALAASRAVLQQAGNMSSATILFILRDLLADAALGDDARIAGLAFGPGLTVESLLAVKHMPPAA